MNQKRTQLAIALLLGTAGCATNQDTGVPGTTLKGLAIDGALAAAQVYVDTNNNNKLDDWEPHALTDEKGYFSKSATGVDYCRDGAPLTDSIHCLRNTSSESVALLRFSGGYDLTTSSKFNGSISAKVSVAAASAGNGVVSNPVTTLFSHMTSAQKTSFISNETAALTTAVGAATTLTEADLATDYTDYTGITNATAKQIWIAKLSMEIHKVVDVIEAGLVKNTVSDARTKTYQALAAANYTTAGFGAYLVAGGNMAALVNAAAGVSTAAWTTPTALDITNRALEVANLAESIFIATNATMTLVELNGRMRAVEILTSGLRDFVNNAAAIAPPVLARSAATTAGDAATYLTTLGTDASFVFSLIKGKFFPIAGATYANAGSLTGIAPVQISTLAGGPLEGSKLAVASGADGASLSFGANNTLSLNIAVSGGSSSPLGGANVISGTYQTLPDGTLVMNLEPLPGVIVPAVINVTTDPNVAGGYLYSMEFNGTTTTFPVPSGQTGFCAPGSTSTTAGTC